MENGNVFKEAQVTKNKKDPLINEENSERARHELFKRFSRASDQFQQRDVVYAAGNLVLNSIRQQCKTSKEAELMYDEFMAHMKRSLIEQHYKPSGARRNVFPFHQTIGAVTIDAKSKPILPG